MKYSTSTSALLARLLALPLLLTLLIQATAKNHHVLTSADSKTSHLLHCLGHSATARADRAKVEALIAANPNPADDRVWSQLAPREWGFKGHDAPGVESWVPVDSAAPMAKDRVMRQHSKLVRCAKRLQLDVMRDAEAASGDAAQPLEQRRQERRVLPDMFGGQGFKQVRQDTNGFPLRRPQVVAKNDAQSVPRGPAADPVDPAAGAVSDIGGGAAPGAAPDTVNVAVDDQKLRPDGTLSPPSPGQKLAPGLGPDQPSVAPALINDPFGKYMPKTLPAAAAAAAAAGPVTDLPQQAPVVPGQTLSAGTTGQNVNMVAVSATTADVTNNGTQNDPTGQKVAVPGQLKLVLKQSGTDAAASTCKSPLIRKEYSSLTRDEKKAFVEAIKCVRSKPSRFKTNDALWNAADDWTLLHIRMVRYVHFTAYFTVFHRGFTVLVERDLNECGFNQGLPWVDWTKTSDDPSTNAVFDSDPDFGLGTDGKGDNSSCPWNAGLAVTDGALADHWFNAPFRHRLCRQFNNLDVHTPSAHFGSNCSTFIHTQFVKGLGATHDDGRFFDFSSAIEIATHLSMHTCVGGNLAWLSSSPNDVVFHAHHGCVDNIFDGWQKKSDKNKHAFHGPKQQQKKGMHPPWTAKRTDVINFEPLAENVMVQDLLDPESGKWGGRMCYRYDYNVAM
ncbi:hypothetical protein EX895_002852 [Sporisorium graminicola]|uniref:Tyrosinase copper-binding domain-containing protein n=1 Tax=Sporisorium graminicola TaxID=280036 RepID=A0A4U7KZ21_9BASI|nr:hypothetical protein EX895_002852 [Sporisorium graminicola]TKY88142.1 hypothetical protein EX895_002852 [Sporisorium graminicola]